ncbi:MAG: hypothetical protein HOC91_11970 [Nitrospinaceae bacterium]|jgi:hypothetical protein|nr:hypothetical protein [Nitrospinaceae bacterium]MBT3432362.1 hypothetical protein [Nitrospinaceae bacterium]MBT3820911.1 hypothetical protein [Nitrospinaceae bacterium]MBT4431224.1 hypothetical protein [Nitrospinaceae bacterium]MBT5369811.1 hypothetical protein [Nitrospinaceae bacterium]
MALIKLINPDEAEGEHKRTFEILSNIRTKHVYSQLASVNSPFLSRIMAALVYTLREGMGTILPSKIKQIAIIKTSQLNNCDY